MREPVAEKSASRLVSLDAYRGFVMLAMASGGLALPTVAAHFPDSQLWSVLENQLDHVRWRGCVFWDLIQPSFMFIVGVAMPFSSASRTARGEPWTRQLAHAAWRSLVLIALGVFLSSTGSSRTSFAFTNVLSQIGLGYTFVYLLVGRRPALQGAVAAGILCVYWLAFALYPVPGLSYPRIDVGVTPSWMPMTGFAAHWEKNTNIAADFDRWFLNLFPQPGREPFQFNPGGYTTLNFVPSIVTMLFGVMAGELLRSARPARSKLQILMIAAALSIVLGTALDGSICPVVKRIWTPSWVIYSTGWTCGLLAVFYGVIDVAGFRRWAFPLVVVGVNSIAMYLMAQLIKPFVTASLRTHFGLPWRALATAPGIDRYVARTYHAHLPPVLFDGLYGSVFRSAAVLLVLWLICLWLYRQRIFIKI